MKIGPKVVLVLCVVALAAVGAWARSAWLAPWLHDRGSARLAAHLERGGLLREGDVVLQASRSRQSRAVQAATRSPWSHCGIVVRRGGKWMVLEAVQPVKTTPLAAWIQRGKGERFALRRLDSLVRKLSSDDVSRLDREGRSFEGKPYDPLFGWRDDRIYCSELVWKVYRRALGVDLGGIQKLSEFDLASPVVKLLMERRYGKTVPLEDSVVSPEALHRSAALVTVLERE